MIVIDINRILLGIGCLAAGAVALSAIFFVVSAVAVCFYFAKLRWKFGKEKLNQLEAALKIGNRARAIELRREMNIS